VPYNPRSRLGACGTIHFTTKIFSLCLDQQKASRASLIAWRERRAPGSRGSSQVPLHRAVASWERKSAEPMAARICPDNARQAPHGILSHSAADQNLSFAIAECPVVRLSSRRSFWFPASLFWRNSSTRNLA
jgi:hypothetical protein